MTRQIMQKASLYFGVLLAGVILCGCYTYYERPHHLSLYHKYYTPNMSEKEVKTLKSRGDYPKEIVVKSGLDSAEMQKFHSALINFYGCYMIGHSGFIGRDGFERYKVSSGIDAWGLSRDEYEYFQTDDVKDPERLAQEVGANYYIVYVERSNASMTTITGVDTKVATQGGMGRANTGGITTTTSQDAQLQRGALFYLCD